MTSRKTAPASAIIVVTALPMLESVAWIIWYRAHGLSGSTFIVGSLVAAAAIFVALRGARVDGYAVSSAPRLGASVVIAAVAAGVALIWAPDRFGT